jgi:hypothetical protein
MFSTGKIFIPRVLIKKQERKVIPIRPDFYIFRNTELFSDFNGFPSGKKSSKVTMEIVITKK